MQKIIIPIALIATLSTLTSCGWDSRTLRQGSSSNVPKATASNSTYWSSNGSNAANYGAPPGGNSNSSHTQEISYETPWDTANIVFNVETKDGFIIGVSATPKSLHQISSGFQKWFANQISSKVMGKSKNNFDVATIAGASLITKAFIEYVNSI